MSSEEVKSDVFIDYPMEDVAFRWDANARQAYRKFYGEKEEPIHFSNNLFNQAILFGDRVTQAAYSAK
jgi:hypothetical protein